MAIAGAAAAFVTQAELDGFRSLGDVLDWAGVMGDPANASTLRGAFLAATGAVEASLPRAFGVIASADFDAVINQVMMAGADVQAPAIAPNLLQRGALIGVGLACRLKTGLLDHLPAGAPVPPGWQVPLPPAGAVALVPGPIVAKVSLGLILKQGDNTEVAIVDDAVMTAGYARYEVVFGLCSRPPPDADVTIGQITCLKHLVDTSQTPYVDFAIWGPHGHRLERKLRLSGSVFDRDGAIRTLEIAGPPTLNVWLSAWEVFATACVLLDIVDLGTLLAYKAHMVGLHSRYGPQSWLLLYQADTRFRAEHLPRTRRILAEEHDRARAAGGTTAFVTARPWSMAFSSGLADNTWWSKEFTESAIMLLARTASLGSLLSFDAPVHSIPGSVAPHADGFDTEYGFANQNGSRNNDRRTDGNGTAKRSKNSGASAVRSERQDLSQIVNGEYTHNRSGLKICGAFQTGGCGQTVGQMQCPSDRSVMHQCSLCLGTNHGKPGCNTKAAPSKKTFKGKGGKGGKGKGKGKW